MEVYKIKADLQKYAARWESFDLQVKTEKREQHPWLAVFDDQDFLDKINDFNNVDDPANAAQAFFENNCPDCIIKYPETAIENKFWPEKLDNQPKLEALCTECEKAFSISTDVTAGSQDRGGRSGGAGWQR